jgi:predicted metal-dependent HD superfamily phosphohydrolase
MKDSTQPDTLRQSWFTLMASLGVEHSVAEELYADILARYRNGSRHYHTLRHVGEVLDNIDKMRHMALDITAIRLAAWYHDVIYDMQANENERKSAEYAAAALERMNLDEERVRAIQDMIQATDLSRPTPSDMDAHILRDADLGTLGSCAARYDEIAEGIRLENAHLADDEYSRARAQVLSQFLTRERIFHTDIMYSALEQSARDNISREIDLLSQAKDGSRP